MAKAKRSPAVPIAVGVITTALCLFGEAWIFSTILAVVPDPGIQPEQVRHVVDLGKLIGAATIAGLVSRLIIDRFIAWHSPIRAAAEIVAVFAILFFGAHRALVYVADSIVDGLGEATAQRAAAIAYYREGVKHGEIVDLDLPAATGDRSPIRRLELVNLAVGVGDVSPNGYAARAMAELSIETRRGLRQVDRQMYAARVLTRQESGGIINEIEARYAEALQEIERRSTAERQERLSSVPPHDRLEQLYLGYERAALALAAAWEGYQKAAGELLGDDACASCKRDFEHLTGLSASVRPRTPGEFASQLILAEPAEPSLLRLKQSLSEAQQVPVLTADGPTSLFAFAERFGFQRLDADAFYGKVDVARDIDAKISEEVVRSKQRAAIEREESLSRVSEAEDRTMREVEKRADEARAAIRDYARSFQRPDRIARQVDRDMIAAAVLPPFAVAVASLGMVGNTAMLSFLLLALLAWRLAAERCCRVLRILAGVVPPLAIVAALVSANPSPANFGGRFTLAVDSMSSIDEWSVEMNLGAVDMTLSWPAIWRRTIDIETYLAQLLA